MPKSSLQRTFGRNLPSQRGWKNIFRSGFIFILALVFLVVLGRGAILTFIKAREASRLANDAKAQVDALSARKQDLNEKINFLETPDGKEAELRSTYNVAKPGESVVLIVDAKAASNTPAAEKSWWQTILSFFGQ